MSARTTIGPSRIPKVCAGFPEEGDCDVAMPGRWGVPPLWCPDCERKRRAHITEQMQGIEAALWGLSYISVGPLNWQL